MNSHCEAGRVFESEKDSSIFISDCSSEYFICYDSPIGGPFKACSGENLSICQLDILKASELPKWQHLENSISGLRCQWVIYSLLVVFQCLKNLDMLQGLPNGRFPCQMNNKRKQSELFLNEQIMLSQLGFMGMLLPGLGYLRIFLIIARLERVADLPMWTERNGWILCADLARCCMATVTQSLKVRCKSSTLMVPYSISPVN